MKKHLILSLLLVFIITPNLFSQSENIGINTTSPDNSSALHVTYVTTPKGMLIPRMTTAQRGSIPAPIANALLIFNTTTNQFEHYDAGSTTWVGLADATTYTVDQFVSTDASGNLQTFDFSQDLSATTAGVATVTGIQTRAVSNTAPTNGQVLQWDGTASEWVPTTPAGGAGGNTLDAAYDEGGAGSGRTINVTDGAVQFASTNAADESVEITNSGNGGALFVENTGTGQTLLVNDEASDTTPFAIDNAGNVGVKTNAPSASLDVEGDFKLGDDGTVFTSVIRRTVSVTIPDVDKYEQESVEVNFTGAETGSTVIVNPSSDGYANGRLAVAYSRVSASGKVMITFHNATDTDLNGPNTLDFYITVIK